MRGALLLSCAVLLVAFVLAWGCRPKAPEEESVPKAGGVFSDVIEAIDRINSSEPKEVSRDEDVPRGEWAMIMDARERLVSPRFVYESSAEEDYSEAGNADEGGQGDALDMILDAEWDEYRNLSASIVPDSPNVDIRKAMEDSLVDFYKDLPGLMAVVPDTLRERVTHIVVLRYYNTILRAGVDPRLFIGPPSR